MSEGAGETSRTSSGRPERGKATGGLEQRASQLVTDQGRTSIADSVVAKIAGISALEISGVHAMGTGAARAVGAIRDMIPVGASTSHPSQGVKVEVGERQAAVDLDIVVDYGISIVDVADAVRKNVISRIQGMTGLEVAEVNVSVDDIWMGEEEEEERPEPRVE